MLPECVTQAPFHLTTTWIHRRSHSVGEAEQRDSQHLSEVRNISAKALDGECTPPSLFVPQKSRRGAFPDTVYPWLIPCVQSIHDKPLKEPSSREKGTYPEES